jgi:hypothetical protein
MHANFFLGGGGTSWISSLRKPRKICKNNNTVDLTEMIVRLGGGWNWFRAMCNGDFTTSGVEPSDSATTVVYVLYEGLRTAQEGGRNWEKWRKARSDHECKILYE